MPRPIRRTRVTRAPRRLSTRHVLSILDLTPAQLRDLVAVGVQMFRERRSRTGTRPSAALAGLHVALLFEKPSLRTRSTFEIAVRELGGDVIAPPQDVAMGEREPIADVARNLERWVTGVVIRTFAQTRLVEFAESAPTLHVINALTDEEHPCQALADMVTLQQHLGDVKGETVAFVGDGNNVATSLAHAAVMLGMHVHVASPDGYALSRDVLDQCAAVAQHGARVKTFTDPRKAVRGVAAVYTDAWTSMGQEAEAQHRRKIFAPFQVNEDLMAASGGARFMHCLPAHRGEEATDAVMDGPDSIIFDQAENRLHAQKALLMMLMGR